MTRTPEAEQRLAAPALADVLTVAQRVVARGVSAALAEERCTLDEWRVMRALGDGEGHLMGSLAEALAVPHATLTRLVEGLVDAGLVYRRQSTDDRRRVAVLLSRVGAERLGRLDALVARQEQALRESSEWAELAEQVARALR